MSAEEESDCGWGLSIDGFSVSAFLINVVRSREHGNKVLHMDAKIVLASLVMMFSIFFNCSLKRYTIKKQNNPSQSSYMTHYKSGLVSVSETLPMSVFVHIIIICCVKLISVDY